MYQVVPVGLAMHATVGNGRDSDYHWASVSGFEFGREFYKRELIQLQSWLSLFGICMLFCIDCICLFCEIPWIRVISRIPFQVGNSAIAENHRP